MLKRKIYLKLLMSLMLVALTVPQVMAAEHELTVAEGTVTNDHVPLYDYCYDTQGTISRIVYPADMLSSMSEKTVTKITFYFANRLAFGGGELSVKVGEVNTTAAVDVSSSNLTEVWRGSIPTSGTTLEFDVEDFVYNGGNLAIETNVVTKGTYKEGSTFYGITATGASWCNKLVANSYDFLPQATFTYEGEATPYAAKVTPTSLSFGKAMIGSTPSLSVVLSNKGTETLPYSLSGLSAPFSTSVTSGTVASGEQIQIPVTFAPTATENYEGEMVISFPGTDLENITVPVTGAGTNNICDGEDESENLPVWGYWFDQAQFNQMLYPASKLGALNGKKLTKLTFYPKNGINFYSNNNSTVVLKLANVVSGTTFSYPLEPEKTTVKTITMPTSAQSGITEWVFEFDESFDYTGGDLLVEVVTTTGKFGATTFYGENQPEVSSYYKRSGANATASNFLPKVTFAYEGTPVITVNPATVDAFSTVVGTPATATVNVSGENLTGDITADISGENANCFTAVLENGVLTITYNPTAAGNHTATLTLSSAGAQDVTIALAGTATAPAQPYAVTVNPENGYDFGNVIVNNSKVLTLTVTNNGTEAVTPTLSALEAPFTTNYTAAALSAGQSVNIEITFTPTEKINYSSPLTILFPEANGAIANYTYNLTGIGVDESYDPTAEKEVVKLITVDKRSIYEPAFIDNANGNTTPQQLNCYDMRFRMAQLDDPTKQIKAGDLRPGNNLFEFYAIDDFGTQFRFATINLFAEGQAPAQGSTTAMDPPITVTPSVEYYTEEGMPVHQTFSHNTTLNYTEKTYTNVNDTVDLYGVIDYVNDTWSANTATNAHPDHYKFQVRGIGQYGELVTSIDAAYVKEHRKSNGAFDAPDGWDYGSYVGPNTESDGTETFYFYDLYIKRSFFEERGITGPVTVVINGTLSGSGFNADNYKVITVNDVEQIIAKEAYKNYTWTVPMLDSIPEDHTVTQESMGIIIRTLTTGSDFNKITSISIYGGGTGVSNIDTVGIYKSSMNVKAYTQKQVDEDTDRNLVAMKNGDTETNAADVNVLAYADPAVTGYTLYENSSASTTGMTQVATATHNANGSYSVNSVSQYTATYDYERDESLGNIDGRWLPMYPADASKYFLPVTTANGVGDDGVVRSEGNTYGSAMQQVEENGSVTFYSSKCFKGYTWTKDDVKYALYSPEVNLTSTLPTGYELYNYRLWIDYEDDAPAWDFESINGKINLTDKMDRPLYDGTETHIGGEGHEGQKDDWAFVAPDDLEEVKLVARFYYKKSTASHAPGLKARPTDSDRLYYVVENQVKIPTENIVTGIDNVLNKSVANVKYYNLMGVESATPFQGVNIVVTTYDDGTRSSRKVIK